MKPFRRARQPEPVEPKPSSWKLVVSEKGRGEALTFSFSVSAYHHWRDDTHGFVERVMDAAADGVRAAGFDARLTVTQTITVTRVGAE